jgi:hypothetical protein
MGHMNDYLVGKSHNISRRQLASHLIYSAKIQVVNIYRFLIRMGSFGGIFLLLLVFTGLFHSSWDRTRMLRECYVGLILAGIFIALFSTQSFSERYLYVILPFLLLWGAKGIEELTVWASDTYRIVSPNSEFWMRPIRLGMRLTLVGILLGIALWQNTGSSYDDFGGTKKSCIYAKEAGLWLKRQSPQDKVIMDAGSAIPYYSRAEYLIFPYCTSSTAIRYIRLKNPDYIVLRGSLKANMPYLEEWLETGIPDSHAIKVYDVGNTLEEKVQIYRWENNKVNR